MNELPFINDVEVLIKELNALHHSRKSAKIKRVRKYVLSAADREAILKKTDGCCHICGLELSLKEFQADHIRSHSKGGNNKLDNFLAACTHCNNLRWHYSSEEVQWILSLGVWLKSEIAKGEAIGRKAAEAFIKKEVRREQRRKMKREPKA